MKSELCIGECCFYHYLGRKEVLKLEKETLYADLINQTNGRRIPGMRRVSLSLGDIDLNAGLSFFPERSTISRFKEARFTISRESYDRLLKTGEFHSGCGPIAEIYVGILGRTGQED